MPIAKNSFNRLFVSDMISQYESQPNFSDLNECDKRFTVSVSDAKHRYNLLYKKPFNNDSYQKLLENLFVLWYKANPKISLSDDAFDLTFDFKGKHVTLDVNYDEPETIFISTFKSNKDKKNLVVMDCTFENYMGMLEKLCDS